MNDDTLKKLLKESYKEAMPHENWKKNTRDTLMHFTRTHIPISSKYPSSYRPLMFGVIGFVIFLLILIPTTSVLAYSAKPGDTLYRVSRIIEQARLAFSNGEQRKEVIQEQLEKRVADLEYSSQLEKEEYETQIAEDLIDQTQDIIENDAFTLEEKREIAQTLREKLTLIEEKKKRESLSEHIGNVKTILSKTEIKIEYKENSENNNGEEVLGIGGIEVDNSENKNNLKDTTTPQESEKKNNTSTEEDRQDESTPTKSSPLLKDEVSTDKRIDTIKIN